MEVMKKVGNECGRRGGGGGVMKRGDEEEGVGQLPVALVRVDEESRGMSPSRKQSAMFCRQKGRDGGALERIVLWYRILISLCINEAGLQVQVLLSEGPVAHQRRLLALLHPMHLENKKIKKKHIGPVGQEPVLFARTVEENISYGLSNVSMEAVEQAATKANAHEFISCLPTGYQTRYTKINKDLNAAAGGSDLYLWFSKGSGEFNTPIVDITVTGDADDEAPMFGPGWERVTCDLNRKAGGNDIHIWLKRKEQTYICDVIATDSYGLDTDHFKAGYIRVDEDTNRGAQGSDVFIWFRQTTDPEKGLKDLQVSITDSQYQEYQQQNYQPVNVNLNEGAKGVQEYLWYKKEGSKNPIKAITLLLNKNMITDYMRAGVQTKTNRRTYKEDKVQNTAYVGIADLFSVIKLFCGGLLFWFMVKFSLGRKLLTTRSSLELLLCSLSSFLFSRNTQVIIIQLNVLLSRPPPPGGLERHDSTQ
ncbi:hypothetical protein F7725_012225 [Dissostichus mawsoni]|uniref:MABP domain-containing protein n=1 Tax=Dissostichus mawsoni TaxID=36200 RepID=A0A7J5YMW7_DISMA|nr:hypothetical protein F7725_012225 [Dissostichus mawsoni]